MKRWYVVLGAVLFGGFAAASLIHGSVASPAPETPKDPVYQTVAAEQPSTIQLIEPEELRDEMKSAKPPILLDVREPSEREVAKIGHDENIPLGELEQRFSELSKDKPIVVYCRSGHRSARAAAFLLGKGFTKIKSLDGGMNAWTQRIDSTSCPAC